MTAPIVELMVEDERWLEELPDLETAVSAGARLALDAADLADAAVEIAVLACNDARIAALNADHRGRAAPTNVLSWPAFSLAPASPGKAPPVPPGDPDGAAMPLGDVAIALETCVTEAKVASIPLKTHVIHLILHAVLHLLGYDHEREEDADLMEGLERRAMISAGFPDPYGSEETNLA